jgi:hypothetical protein
MLRSLQVHTAIMSFLSDCHCLFSLEDRFCDQPYVQPLLSYILSRLALRDARSSPCKITSCVPPRPNTHNNNLYYSQYTVTATCTGGLDGTISSTPADETAPLNLKLTTPKALGGSGDSGHNPDQLLAAGYSGKLNQYSYL